MRMIGQPESCGAAHRATHPSSDLMNTQAELIDWLRDSYAMEKALETALTKLTDHPHTHMGLREQAGLHRIDTQVHAEAIAGCLKALGSDTSSLRTVLAQGMDLMRSAGSSFGRDERIKDVLTVLVTEHFEIACHTILRTGALQLGMHDIVQVCDEILLGEKRMTHWLQINLPQIIAAYLAGELEAVKEAEIAKEAEKGDQKHASKWEFIQMAHIPMFGGKAHGHAFANMLN
ncbi:MAG: hypothetical protein B7Z47_00865 [Chthoniobacter sp. 12-60-6]|nr:MAG: hypothetical protein B7Z47_00865 [Chthoniobacter sp. 12-60-6]